MSHDEALFCAEVSVRYHRRRATFLERTSSILSVLVLFGGASAFASLFSESTTFAKVVTLILTLLGVVQTVFRIDSVAAEHKNWLKEWLKLLSALKHQSHVDTEMLVHWNKRRYEIESECVGEMRALQIDCFNRTVVALGYPEKPTPMKWFHRAFIQVISFEGSFPNPVPSND